MALRTPEQFCGSLADGRDVWLYGEKVTDVREHPELRVGVSTACVDYAVAEEAECEEFAVVHLPDGEPASRYFWAPRSKEDLLLRRRLIEECSRRACGVVPLAKDAGSDGLNGLSVIAPKLDRACGTAYMERVEAFRNHLQERDLSLALAMTDPKGDRMLRPSEQAIPDYYLRIVERRTDGIVVRGAKAHISTAPYTNEILVLPTRQMTAADADYAVAFAIPVNTPGIRVIARPSRQTNGDSDEYPISSRFDLIEGLVIFQDVFVPWERVFLAGEWQWTGSVTGMFANFHRFTAASYKYPALQLLAGAAAWIAECNGTDKVSHIKDKVTWLAIYAETLHALTYAAALQAVVDPDTGIAYPCPLIGNLAKFYFADNYHQAVKAVQDVAGGIVVTAPHMRDYNHPDLGPLIDTYLGGKAGISTAERMRAIKLVRDLVASDFSGFWEVTTIHAEGSLAAERLVVSNVADLEGYKRLAKVAGGLGSQGRD